MVKKGGINMIIPIEALIINDTNITFWAFLEDKYSFFLREDNDNNDRININDHN